MVDRATELQLEKWGMVIGLLKKGYGTDQVFSFGNPETYLRRRKHTPSLKCLFSVGVDRNELIYLPWLDVEIRIDQGEKIHMTGKPDRCKEVLSILEGAVTR